MNRTVREVMTPDPLTVDATTSVKDAATLMRARAATDVLVIENGEFRGLLTDSDIVVVAIAAGRHPATIPVGECCNPEPASIGANEPAIHAAELMRRHGVDRLLVLDDGQPVGFVSARAQSVMAG